MEKPHKEMDNQRLIVIKKNISSTIQTGLLSPEITQESAKADKLMNVAERISSSTDGRLGQNKENEREENLESRSLKSDPACKGIRVSVIISPIKRIRNIVKDRRIETVELSWSSETKRNKDFDSSCVKISKNDSKINIYTNCDDNAREDFSSTEQSASNSSCISRFPDELIITLESSDDENANRDYSTTRPSLSSIRTLPDEQIITIGSSDDENANASKDCTTAPSSSLSISTSLGEQEVTLDPFIDENASRDCIAIEPSMSADANGNSDCLSAEESSFNLDQEFPYECVHCNRRFSEAHNLYYHSKYHGKTFICKRCNRPFKWGSDFIHHIKRHTKEGGIPFNCSICNHGYTNSYYLRKHMMINHRMNLE